MRTEREYCYTCQRTVPYDKDDTSDTRQREEDRTIVFQEFRREVDREIVLRRETDGEKRIGHRSSRSCDNTFFCLTLVFSFSHSFLSFCYTHIWRVWRRKHFFKEGFESLFKSDLKKQEVILIIYLQKKKRSKEGFLKYYVMHT